MKPLEFYFQFLACVARADGRVSPAEQDAVQAAVAASGLEPAIVERLGQILDLSRPFDVEALLVRAARSLSPTLLAEVLRDAYAMALLDGELHPREIALVDRLLDVAGVTERGRTVLHAWAEAAARQHLDGLALLRDVTSAPPVG
jgi:uncharacterized tellurite resistance protein B-like protein